VNDSGNVRNGVAQNKRSLRAGAVEATVSNKDIGFVHDGQEAEIKIDTFTKYDLLHERVMMSLDAFPQLAPSPEWLTWVLCP
jgi:hypothetical protein